MALESSEKNTSGRPDLSNYVIIRFRNDGVVAWTMGPGEPRMGVRSGPKTEAMREAIEAAYADAISLEVKI